MTTQNKDTFKAGNDPLDSFESVHTLNLLQTDSDQCISYAMCYAHVNPDGGLIYM